MARKHVSLRISEETAVNVKALAREFEIPSAVVLRAAAATGFAHLADLRKTLDQIRKAP